MTASDGTEQLVDATQGGPGTPGVVVVVWGHSGCHSHRPLVEGSSRRGGSGRWAAAKHSFEADTAMRAGRWTTTVRALPY